MDPLHVAIPVIDVNIILTKG